MLKEVIAHTLEEEVLSSEGDLASWPSWRFCVAVRAGGHQKNNWPSLYSSVPQLLQLHAQLARARRLDGTSFQINFSSRADPPVASFLLTQLRHA